jgi:hypothetical protein
VSLPAVRREAAPSRPGHALLRLLQTDAAAIGVLLLLAAVAFSPWWLQGRILVPMDVLHETFAPWRPAGDAAVDVHNHFTSDAVTQYVVYRAIAARSFAEDGYIGWNTLVGGGRPEYANTMALYGDWTVQLHRVMDFWTAWHVGLLATLLLAAIGMFVLLRSQRIAPLTALAGAVAFGASTPLVFTLYHRWHVAAFAWVPWLAWAVLAHRAGARRLWALPPLFLALALLGGSLQTAVFVLLVWAALWLDTLLGATAGERWRVTGRFVGWGALGAGIAAFVLLPSTLMYLGAVDLHGDRSALGYRDGWQQVAGAVAFVPLQLAPTLLGSPRSLDLAKLFHVELTQVAFFGAIPMIVAVLATVRGGVPVATRLLVAAGLLLPLTPLVGPLYHRVQLVFVFGGVWAFAHFWQHGRATPGLDRRLGLVVAVAGAAWLALSAGLYLYEAELAALVRGRVDAALAGGAAGQLTGFTAWYAERAGRLVRELRIWHPAQLAAVAGIVLGLTALRLRTAGLLQPAAAVILAAVAVELGAQATSWHRFMDPVEYPPYPLTHDLRALQEIAGDGTVYIAAGRAGPAPFLPLNTLAMYGIRTIQQFETVDLPGMWQQVERSADAAVLGRLGVTHAVAPPGQAPAAGWGLAYAGGTLDVWANDAAVARYIGLPGSAGGSRTEEPGNHDESPVPVRVRHASMNRRTLEVGAGASAVRVAENWSGGWEYRVGGDAWRDVQPAPDRSMVLPLPEADRPLLVEMRYRPGARTAGRMLSAVSLLLTLGGGLAAARAGHRPAGAAGPEPA